MSWLYVGQLEVVPGGSQDRVPKWRNISTINCDSVNYTRKGRNSKVNIFKFVPPFIFVNQSIFSRVLRRQLAFRKLA